MCIFVFFFMHLQNSIEKTDRENGLVSVSQLTDNAATTASHAVVSVTMLMYVQV